MLHTTTENMKFVSFFFSLFSLTHCFEKWLMSGIQRAKEYLEQANVAFSPTSFFVNVELDKQQFNAGRLIKAMSDVSFPEGNLSKILASVRCLTFSFSLVCLKSFPFLKPATQ